MSEYWKSTPKYWCKHCKTFVRDTKLEKQNHDATPKHQGNIKRFLRDLHRGNEREEREKQRAKDEVARLNGEKPGASATSAVGSTENSRRRPPAAAPSSSSLGQLTPAERKRQLAQLAELGVAVPEDYRREVAMPGDWQVTSEKAIYENEHVKKEEEAEEKKPGGLNVGVRKRKLVGHEDEEELGQPVARRVWGSTTRKYPGYGGDDDELDALLSSTTTSHRNAQHDSSTAATTTEVPVAKSDIPTVKEEESLNEPIALLPSVTEDVDTLVKEEDEDPEGDGFLFKKRKPKSIRQE